MTSDHEITAREDDGKRRERKPVSVSAGHKYDSLSGIQPQASP